MSLRGFAYAGLGNKEAALQDLKEAQKTLNNPEIEFFIKQLENPNENEETQKEPKEEVAVVNSNNSQE
jgi:regulator of sirC expression with transglutaminase-like and TPR domain